MLQIGLVIDGGFNTSCLSPLSVFDTANVVVGERRYATRLLSENGGSVRGASGFEITTDGIDEAYYDTLLIAGGDKLRASGAALASFLLDASRSARRIASFGLGAFALGDAGLLDGRRATTHWSLIDELRRRYPVAKVEKDCLFVADGPIWTSAGMTASVDLAMTMLESDLGVEVALEVARQQVLGQRRHARHPQKSMMLDIAPKSDRVQSALSYARANLRGSLMVEDLADAACLSPRQFSRVFSAETGCSPARAVEKLRVEAAHLLVTQGRLALDTIAQEAGFDDPERMRRAFIRTFGESPNAIRRRADPRINI